MKFTFHTFKMGDVEDVEIYASYPIDAWQKTEQGRWVTERCKDLAWQTVSDYSNFGHHVAITGSIDNPLEITEYLLRWPDKK